MTISIVNVDYGETKIINVEQRRSWILTVELVNPGIYPGSLLPFK